ncbi:hypothetical protein Q2589_004575 [Salmonella enterica]|nr:hypothetical protein [Salmonella enterica]ELM5566261.1 hypothetical protein [Salmonella enterica]
MADLFVAWLPGYHWGIFGAKSGFLGILGQKRTYEDRASSYNHEMQLIVIYRRIYALGRSFSILEN